MDIRWLAGFFDADGTVGVYRSDKKRPEQMGIRVQVVGLHRGSIDAYKDAFGGSTYLDAPRGGRRAIWHWVGNGFVALKSLAAMEPHLVVKREQALRALEFPFDGPRGHRFLTASELALRELISTDLMRMKQEMA